jgi:hypothetical protein
MGEGGVDMETFAVTVFPVAKPSEWRAWVDSIASGDRADAHRQMMRRLDIKRERRPGSHAGSHPAGRLCGFPDSYERRAGKRPRSRTDLSDPARPRGYLPNRRLCPIRGR